MKIECSRQLLTEGTGGLTDRLDRVTPSHFELKTEPKTTQNHVSKGSL